VIWADPSGELLAVAADPEEDRAWGWRLLAHGALLVGGLPGPLGGCLSWGVDGGSQSAADTGSGHATRT
jgi:hypothetical protein